MFPFGPANEVEGWKVKPSCLAACKRRLVAVLASRFDDHLSIDQRIHKLLRLRQLGACRGTPMAIIAITQHPGTRAIELGRSLASRLGYRFLTADDLIATASRLYGVTPEQLVIVDERRPHFWERLKTDTKRFVPLFAAVALKEMVRGRVIL